MDHIPSATFIQFLDKPNRIAKIQSKRVENQLIIKTHDFNCNGSVIQNCEFPHGLIIEGVDLQFGLKFKDCKFGKEFFIQGCTSEGSSQEISEDSANIILENCKITELKLHINNFERGIRIVDQTEIGFLEIFDPRYHKSSSHALCASETCDLLGFEIPLNNVHQIRIDKS